MFGGGGDLNVSDNLAKITSEENIVESDKLTGVKGNTADAWDEVINLLEAADLRHERNHSYTMGRAEFHPRWWVVAWAYDGGWWSAWCRTLDVESQYCRGRWKSGRETLCSLH